MNHVTRGMGKTSGMLATGGLGRRVLVYIELIAQHVAAVSRVWALRPETRAWLTNGTRVWETAATIRSWGARSIARTWAVITDSRSWIGSKLRIWSNDGD